MNSLNPQNMPNTPILWRTRLGGNQELNKNIQHLLSLQNAELEIRIKREENESSL